MTSPKKALGQNFLMHAQTAARIVAAANLEKGSLVLEIGPGTGMLTRELLAEGMRVIAVEADRELVPELRSTFSDEIANGTLTLLHQDIRTFDAASIAEPYALVANIPYYITGEIIRTFLEATHQPVSMTLLVQKEVAERVARSKKESLLSIAVKVYGMPKYQFTVPRGAFRPAPNVDSAVLSIQNIRNPFTDEQARDHFFSLVRAGFAHKRKLLSGNLAGLADSGTLKKAFLEADIPARARAEDVPLSAWLKLSSTIS